jgi:membrane-associated phospholipid phosphatase
MMYQKNFGLIVFLFSILPVLEAQENDSVNNPQYNKPLKALEIAIPAAMITYSIISIESDWLKELDYSTRDELIEDKLLWYNGWDDYFQFSPSVAAFSMKLYGVQSVHKLSDMFILYTLSNALDAGIVYATKNITGRQRPDGSNYHSFPSGHTSTAFVAAEFLHQEYGDKSVWISIGGYSMASLIGVSRVYRNKHWVSDVIAGAGIGILSTKCVYWAYPYLQKTFGKKGKKLQTFIFPAYNSGNLSLNLSCQF